MNRYTGFIEFFEANKRILFSDDLRPAKSITRNIITSVKPFIDFYKNTGKLSLTEEEIAVNILELPSPSTTSKDNIRNMMELKFLAYSDTISGKCYYFTRSFIDFVNSGETLKDYIYEQLCNIKSILDITMFYNCILLTLREGLIFGEIINYPDSYSKFVSQVNNPTIRYGMCEKVYNLYGFKGRNKEFGTYTPNAIYRIISTCLSLGLVKENGLEMYGMKKYIITEKGYKLIEKLNIVLK